VDRHAAQGMPITYIHRTNAKVYKPARWKWAEDFSWRVRRYLRCGLSPNLISSAHDSVLYESRGRRKNRHGEDALDVSQQRLLLAPNVETILLDGHFVVEHGARSRRGTFFNFNGTAGVWRRKAIVISRWMGT